MDIMSGLALTGAEEIKLQRQRDELKAQNNKAEELQSKQGFGNAFKTSAGNQLGASAVGLTGQALTDKMFGTPGEQAKRFMDEAYPGSNLAERIGANAGGSVGSGATQARTAKEIASIQASATKQAAKTAAQAQVDVANIQQGEGEKAKAEIENLKQQARNAKTDADKKEFAREFWRLYIKKETALPITHVPDAMLNDLGFGVTNPGHKLPVSVVKFAEKYFGMPGVIDWIYKYRPKKPLKKNASPSGEYKK
jgi:hypothetical protein